MLLLVIACVHIFSLTIRYGINGKFQTKDDTPNMMLEKTSPETLVLKEEIKVLRIAKAKLKKEVKEMVEADHELRSEVVMLKSKLYDQDKELERIRKEVQEYSLHLEDIVRER